MERWLKSVDAVVIDPAVISARAAAVKAEMSARWDATATREKMLSYIEMWLAKDAPVQVRGHVLREELYPLMVEVYQSKYPEDFSAKVVDGRIGEIEP